MERDEKIKRKKEEGRRNSRARYGRCGRRADRTVAVKMPISSPDSLSNWRASGSVVSPQAIITRSQNADSRDSFRQMQFLTANSRREYADFDSSEFAPTEVPASC